MILQLGLFVIFYFLMGYAMQDLNDRLLINQELGTIYTTKSKNKEGEVKIKMPHNMRLEELPQHLTILYFQYLEPNELHNLRMVSKTIEENMNSVEFTGMEVYGKKEFQKMCKDFQDHYDLQEHDINLNELKMTMKMRVYPTNIRPNRSDLDADLFDLKLKKHNFVVPFSLTIFKPEFPSRHQNNSLQSIFIPLKGTQIINTKTNDKNEFSTGDIFKFNKNFKYSFTFDKYPPHVVPITIDFEYNLLPNFYETEKKIKKTINIRKIAVSIFSFILLAGYSTLVYEAGGVGETWGTENPVPTTIGFFLLALIFLTFGCRCYFQINWDRLALKYF